MTISQSTENAGGFAISTGGHDAGILYLIVGSNKYRILLVDGKHHKLANPKSKNVKHLRQLPECVYEKFKARIERENLTDAEIRRVLATVKSANSKADQSEEGN